MHLVIAKCNLVRFAHVDLLFTVQMYLYNFFVTHKDGRIFYSEI